MNMEHLKGNWKQLKGKVRSQWGKLTDDDVEQIAGKKDELVGRLQARYGTARDEAEREVDSWLSKL
ncbi:MAG: CsbD family protein [Polyangiaceae bacterium]|nr:CsbD family protein [Myxococcales bacterium]MCB9584844.1 CsbD family protein [Polyangiaceae bacterium]MCB9607583.1 CsbD family protein [Polyangiaceae bacterium]